MHVVQSLPSITTLPLQSVSTLSAVSTAVQAEASSGVAPFLSRVALALLVPSVHAP